jgi:MFS family permease
MYSEPLRETFALSHGEFGSLYAIGTLSSGLLIIGVGSVIDRLDLRIYAPILCACMAGACALMSNASGIVTLTLAIFALRFCGQGLLSQAATVTMARYFEAGMRGRAVSTAALGFPAGQALFPAAAVILIATLPWRDVWSMSALVVLAVVPAATLWLLRGHGARHAEWQARTHARSSDANAHSERQWERREVLRDRNFYLMMLAMLASSFIITGLNFHQVHLVAVKGWDLQVYATSFVAYAACQVGASVITGALIDRFGSRALARFYLLPLSAAAFTLASMDSQIAVVLFMALAGISGGAGATIVSTIWAELYGVRHLGSIKALVDGLAVISSALAPPLFGVLIDHGMGITTLAAGCGLYALCGSALLTFIFARR